MSRIVIVRIKWLQDSVTESDNESVKPKIWLTEKNTSVEKWNPGVPENTDSDDRGESQNPDFASIN